MEYNYTFSPPPHDINSRGVDYTIAHRSASWDSAGMRGGGGALGVKYMLARHLSAREKIRFFYLIPRPSANRQIYPIPYNAGDLRVGIVSGRGGERALGMIYDAQTMGGDE
jgi:hypothetical protein